MSTHTHQGQAGLAPCEPQTLTDYAREALSMGDEEIQAEILVMEGAAYLGKSSRDRAEILRAEQSRRWRKRRGEGRAA